MYHANTTNLQNKVYTANNNIIIIVYVTKHVVFNNEKKNFYCRKREAR